MMVTGTGSRSCRALEPVGICTAHKNVETAAAAVAKERGRRGGGGAPNAGPLSGGRLLPMNIRNGARGWMPAPIGI